MKITITTNEKLRIRTATQLLSAITLMDDAVSMTEESADALVARLNDAYPGRSVGQELSDLGKQLLDSESDLDLDEIDWLLIALVAQEHVQQCASEDDLELLKWGAGSVRGQFRKSLKALGEKLRKALQSLNNLLPSVDPAGFKAALKEILSTNLSPSARQVAAGVMGTAAVCARHALYELNAGEVIVEDTE